MPDKAEIHGERVAAYLESKLHRPKLNYPIAVSCVLVALLLSTAVACVALFVLQDAGCLEKGAAGFFAGFAWAFPAALLVSTLGSLRSISIFAIRLYQRYADAETRLRCRQTPSCSNYGILAIEKHGALRGIWKTIQRLKRCRPPGRVDFP